MAAVSSHIASTKMLGLTELLYHCPEGLSGSARRVAVARAIILEPEIALGILRKRNNDLGQTVVKITHHLEAAAYTDRVIHIRDGVIADGMPAD